MISDLAWGAGLLGKGLALVLRRPRLFGLGLVPPLISSVLMGILFVVLLFNVGSLAAALTGWASGGLAEAMQILFSVLIVIAAVVIMAITFSSITLGLGAPVYDKISEAVEAESGGVTGRQDEGLATSVPRAVGQSIVLIAISVVAALPLFLLGLIPLVGSVVGAVVGAVFGGWMITIELISGAFDRRGRTTLREKFALMRTSPFRVLGFGVPVFLLVSIPLVAIAAFPAATAGGTMLARRLVGEPEPARR